MSVHDRVHRVPAPVRGHANPTFAVHDWEMAAVAAAVPLAAAFPMIPFPLALLCEPRVSPDSCGNPGTAASLLDLVVKRRSCFWVYIFRKFVLGDVDLVVE